MPTDKTKRPQSDPAGIPIILAMVLLPLAGAVTGVTGLYPGHMIGNASGLAMHTLWLAVAGFGLLLSLSRRLSNNFKNNAGLAVQILPPIAGFGLALFMVGYLAPKLALPLETTQYLSALSPLFYLILAAVWVWSFGPPSRQVFLSCGAVLGASVFINTLLAWVLTGHPMPGLGLLPGGEPGNEYRASMLLACICATLVPGKKADRSEDLLILLIGLGLLATFSATCLFTAAWIVLFLGAMKFRFRAIFALACVLFAAWPYILPGGPLPSAHPLDTYLAWASGLNLFADNPQALISGYGPIDPLVMVVPEKVADSLNLMVRSETISPMSIVPFWLKLAVIWGAGGVLLFFGAGFAAVLIRPTAFAAGLVALILAQGLTTPLFYNAPLAMVLFLAMFSALSRRC